MVTPFWDSVSWWPLLVRLQQPGTKAALVKPFQGMFSVPEPTKEGEGKEDEHRAAEALRLFASRVIPYWSLSE